jgi:hypothetical protein
MRADSSSSMGMLRPYSWKTKIAYGVAKVTMAAITPIWKGGISVGLVNIPVSLYAASEATEEIGFRQLHGKDLAPIQYRRTSESRVSAVWSRRRLAMALCPGTPDVAARSLTIILS